MVSFRAGLSGWKAGVLVVGVFALASCGSGAAPASSGPPASAVSAPASKAVAVSSGTGAAGSGAPGSASGTAGSSAGAAGAGAASSAGAASAGSSGSAASAAPGVAGASAGSKPAAAGNLPHLTVASTPSINAAGVYIGIDRGYFHDAGVDVEVIPFTGGAQQISSIAASQVDMGVTDAGAGVFNALSRNLPMKFVADAARCTKGHCTSSLLVRKPLVDSGQFKALPDLKGKSINPFTPGSSLNLLLYRLLDKAGLKESDVKQQTVTFDQILPAFANGSLDVSWQIEPFTTAIIDQKVGVKFQDSFDLFGPSQSTIVVFSPNMATQKQDAGKKFMVGYLRGVRDYIDAFDNNKDYDAIVSILAKNTALKDPATYKRMTVPDFEPNGSILVDQIQQNEDMYVARGDIKSPTPVSAIYDHTYIDYAVSVLGKR